MVKVIDAYNTRTGTHDKFYKYRPNGEDKIIALEEIKTLQ